MFLIINFRSRRFHHRRRSRDAESNWKTNKATFCYWFTSVGTRHCARLQQTKISRKGNLQGKDFSLNQMKLYVGIVRFVVLLLPSSFSRFNNVYRVQKLMNCRVNNSWFPGASLHVETRRNPTSHAEKNVVQTQMRVVTLKMCLIFSYRNKTRKVEKRRGNVKNRKRYVNCTV